MKVHNLTVKQYLSHLRRHPMPELISDECIAALSNIEGKYGDAITHMTMLEVRLGEEARYADYIIEIDEQSIPLVETLWHEVDYEEYAKGGTIKPCLFVDTSRDAKNGNYGEFWDKVLPSFLGDERAKKLRAPLDRTTAALPKGAYIKQIGTMTGRNEMDIMRLVIMFPSWESISQGLAAVGWPGDMARLQEDLSSWQATRYIAVNLDLGEEGILPKIGIELFHCWRHPLLVDKLITRLEEAGLCLPGKAAALRRWIRIRPDGDPLIQTMLVHFKLNYKDGKCAEAKAYLAQVPCFHHYYFDAYDRPVYMQMQLKDEADTLTVGEAIRWLYECEDNRVRKVQFIGGTAYEHLDRLLEECDSGGLEAEVLLTGRESMTWLEKAIEAGAAAFIIEIDTAEADLSALKILQTLEFPAVRVKLFMNSENAGKLEETASLLAGAYGVEELILTGMRPGTGAFPNREQLEKTAEFLQKHEEKAEPGNYRQGKMKILVDACFSALRAFLGGEEPTKNGNRGIERGCGAGRDRFCVTARGKLAPCICLKVGEEYSSLAEYWETSDTLQKLRTPDAPRAYPSCDGCAYERRCLPCPAVKEKCPLQL